MIELRSIRGRPILAVPYRRRRPRRPLVIPDGAIVETILPDERREHAPRSYPAYREFPKGSDQFVAICGVYLLSTGEIAAVYGASSVEFA